ncbi:MAG TPA: hypothetical protein VF049_01470 [Nocardioidaceae bacterium]|jgi:hypothetical protein
MIGIHVPSRDNIARPDQHWVSTDPSASVAISHKRRIAAFSVHFVEMAAAMAVGMAAGVPIYLSIAGVSSYSEGLRLNPVPALCAMALSMAVPMAAWMLFRGHGRRNAAEMAAAMIVPAIPFAILAGLHVISGAACRPYMPLSIVAMIGLMLYRWDAYSTPMPAPWRHPQR